MAVQTFYFLVRIPNRPHGLSIIVNADSADSALALAMANHPAVTLNWVATKLDDLAIPIRMKGQLHTADFPRPNGIT